MTEEIDDNSVRDEVVHQLRESLSMSWQMMKNDKLDAKARERWTQIHTNTAQTLNQVLRDRQNRDFEKRLQEIEQARGIRTRGGS